jgi:hypothetical protein
MITYPIRGLEEAGAVLRRPSIPIFEEKWGFCNRKMLILAFLGTQTHGINPLELKGV